MIRARPELFCVYGNCELMQSSLPTNVRFVAFPQPCADFLASVSEVCEGVKSYGHNVQLCEQCSVCLKWIDLCDNHGKLQSLIYINCQTYICSTHFVGGKGPSEMHPDPLPAVMDARDAELDPLMDVKEETKVPPQDMVLKSFAIKAEDCASLVDHAYSYKSPWHFDNQETFGNMMTLKKLGHEMLDQRRSVKYDRESLSVFKFNKHLVEKCCVLDRELNVNIFVQGQKVGPKNRIWEMYPKVWDVEMDFGSFIEDLFDNWYICTPFAKEKSLLDAIVSALRADGQENKYKYDAVSKCIRSVDCPYLSTKTVCYYCHKLETYLESQSPEESQREEQVNKLADLLCTFPMCCHFAMSKLKKNSEEGCQRILDTVIVEEDSLPIVDMTMWFYQELINAKRAKPPSSYDWDPKMINWCNKLNQHSEHCYGKLRKIINVPSVEVLNERNRPQTVGKQSADADPSRQAPALQIRKDLFYNDAMAQPSTSAVTDAELRLLESVESRYYRDVEMVQLLEPKAEW